MTSTNILDVSQQLVINSIGGVSTIAVTDLGLFTSATLETNKAYAGSINGSVSITLPQIASVEIENKITLNLKVLGNSIIDYGVNTNTAINTLAPGNYTLDFTYNNNTSNWVCECLKEGNIDSSLKLLIRFNGNIVDESPNPLTLTPSNFSETFLKYETAQYQQKALAPDHNSLNNYIVPSGDMNKLIFTGDFTVKCWYRAAASWGYPLSLFWWSGSSDFRIALSSDMIDVSYGFGIGEFRIPVTNVKQGDWAHFAMTRAGSSLYFFINGKLIKIGNSSEPLKLDRTQAIFRAYGVLSGYNYAIQELVVKDTCDYMADYAPPTEPYALTDKYIADLHDDTKADKTDVAAAKDEAISTATLNAKTYSDQKSSESTNYADTKAIESKTYTDNKTGELKIYTDDKVDTLQLIKLVEVLPSSGETKYLYAVTQDELTIDNQAILVLYIWTGTAWAAVGALATAIDLADYAKKTDLLLYAKTTDLSNYLATNNPSAAGILNVKSTLRLTNSLNEIALEFIGSDIAYISGNSKTLGLPYGYKILRKIVPAGQAGGYSDPVLFAADKAICNGIASLDATAKIPVEQIPQSILDRLLALEAKITTLEGGV